MDRKELSNDIVGFGDVSADDDALELASVNVIEPSAANFVAHVIQMGIGDPG
jgi:hypothetical protein